MENIHFDQNENGDVRFGLTTNDQKQHGYIVSSADMCQVSKPFSTLMTKHLAERQVSGVVDVGKLVDIPLPEDDADAIGLLLCMIHKTDVPAAVPLERLVQLAVVATKYRFLEVCRTHITEAWMKTNILATSPWEAAYAEYLGLAVAFENDQIYHLAVIGLALTSNADRNLDLPSSLHKRIGSVKSATLAVDQHFAIIDNARKEYCTTLRHKCLDVVGSLSASAFWVGQPSPVQPTEEHGAQYSRHAEQLLALYLGGLANRDILRDTQNNPMDLMYNLCGIARVALSQIPAIQGGERCEVCQIVNGLDHKMYKVVKDVLQLKLGPFLIPSNPWHVAARSDVIKAGSLMSAMPLFESVVGNRLLENGGEDSFEHLEWVAGGRQRDGGRSVPVIEIG